MADEKIKKKAEKGEKKVSKQLDDLVKVAEEQLEKAEKE